jgi:methylglutaconyl-CoA hydratase
MTDATTNPPPGGRAPRPADDAPRSGPARYQTLAVKTRDRVATVTLARPDVHNAFNETLIAELTAALRELDAAAGVRTIVLAGEGRSFCAGADLNWMKRMAGYGHAENLADATALATMLQTLATVSKPTIARVHGAAFGGGVGLVAACDIALAAEGATFSLSEAKLGLIPATISPYVIEAIGVRAAHRYFLSAERFDAAEALRIGLVHEVVGADALDGRVDALVQSLCAAGPAAQAAAKELIRAVALRPVDAAVIADTAERIAAVRASAEGKEGVAAFLGKRAPAWTTPADPESQ